MELLRCEGLVEPRGIDELHPRLSWRATVVDAGGRASAHQLLVATSLDALREGAADLWDTGRIPGSAAGVCYAGAPLASRQLCHWMVRAFDDVGLPSPWSPPASFSMGLLARSDWSGTFVGHRASCPLLRRAFDVPTPVRGAMVHVAVLGVAEITIDGARVSEAQLVSGYAWYERRVPCRSFDVTRLVQPGRHAIGAVLAPGWYAGHWGIGARTSGRSPALLCQLEIELEDGRTITVASGPEWRAHPGPVLSADLLMGEERDHRRAVDGWDAPDLDDAGWEPVEARPWPAAPLRAHPGPPVRRGPELPAREIAATTRSRLFDLGQNISGRTRMRVTAASGDRLQLRHAEVLDERGELHVANLRAARATDVLVAAGRGVETFEPSFTTHGFRYVELSGPPAAVATASLAGVPVRTELPEVGRFACSNPLLERLHEAARWTLRNNALEVPTDCPQRDERLGWTGDVQLAARSWLYAFDVEAFFAKWLGDLADAQREDGTWPDVAPPDPAIPWGTVGWADAAITVADLLHAFRGATHLLERHHAGMERWMALRESGELLPRTRYGDWIAPDSRTPKRVVGGALLAASAQRMARIAATLGRPGAAARWRLFDRRIREAFRKEQLDAEGRLRAETQTGLALSLAHGLLPGDLRDAAAERLRRSVEQEGLRTGFVGTSVLLDVLVESGHVETAYAILESRELPSWGFMLAQGATTIWERWDGYVPGRGFQDPAMNSFDHPPLTSVLAFLYAKVAGIEPLAPGFSRARIQPLAGGSLTHASASHVAPCGEISVSWWRSGNELRVEASIPPGCDAELWAGDARRLVGPGTHEIEGRLCL